KGLRNQGWKDSDEAIRLPDGAAVQGPIATVEEQAFNYIALQRTAEILLALGEEARADAFIARADALRESWHRAFWLGGGGVAHRLERPARRAPRVVAPRLLAARRGLLRPGPRRLEVAGRDSRIEPGPRARGGGRPPRRRPARRRPAAPGGA